MNLNKEQQEIVNATEPFIIVNSCAASGKTTALTQRIAHLIDNGANPDKIVVITFTNQAAAMLKERLGARKIGEMYIGTIHGYCARLLSRGKVQISSILENEKFDELFEKIEENPWCVEEVDYLFVDEAQDCTIEQFDFFDLINPHNRLYVGDFHQAIYGFSGGSVKTFLEYTKRKDVKIYNLFRNYRNAPSILNFARSIIKVNGRAYLDRSISEVKDKNGIVVLDDNIPSTLLGIIKEIQKQENFKDWFILCRYNSQVAIVQSLFTRYNVPFDSFKQSELSHSDLRKKMEADTVKILTIHSSKGLECENVVVIGATTRNAEETCVAYVGATRAKSKLYWLKEVPKSKRKTKSYEFASWET